MCHWCVAKTRKDSANLWPISSEQKARSDPGNDLEYVSYAARARLSPRESIIRSGGQPGVFFARARRENFPSRSLFRARAPARAAMRKKEKAFPQLDHDSQLILVTRQRYASIHCAAQSRIFFSSFFISSQLLQAVTLRNIR